MIHSRSLASSGASVRCNSSGRLRNQEAIQERHLHVLPHRLIDGRRAACVDPLDRHKALMAATRP